MNKIFLVVILFAGTFFSCGSDAPKEEITSFTVHIIRSNMMDEYGCYITRNSVMIIDRNHIDGTWDTFVKYWNDTEKAEIAAMVDSWNANDLVPGPPTTNTDCDSEFTFELERNGKWIWHEDVYKEKVDEVFELTNYVDKLLAKEHKVYYNQEYLDR
jgi:hypothetical protein